MFETSWCPYCRAAREMFQEYSVNVRTIDVEHPKDEDRALISEHFKGMRVGVPQIVVEGEFVVGFHKPKLRQLLCISD